MTQYHVDAAQVAAASALTGRSAETIRGEVAGMLSQLQALEGSWQGGAATAFSGVVSQWRATQMQVEVALDEITRALAQAAEHYQMAEDTAQRMFAH